VSGERQYVCSQICRVETPQETVGRSYRLWVDIAREEIFLDFLTNSLDKVFFVCYSVIMDFCTNGRRYTYYQVSHCSLSVLRLLLLLIFYPPPPRRRTYIY
jgi:hypothetical protein